MTAYRQIVLGIDPGKSGALALVGDGHLIDVTDMPAADGAALGACLREYLSEHAPHTPTLAVVEQAQPMPKQGVVSVFTYGKNYGALLGALGFLGVPLHNVTPAIWKKATPGVTRDKDTSRQKAMELWPVHAVLFKRKKDDGRAEAALIARYGHLTLHAP